MAEKDRTSPCLRPEEKLAKLLLSRRDLTPPIAIESIIQEYADLEEDHLPASCDAVLIRNPPGRSRPLIVLDKLTIGTRMRFTLAHEFGHLMIPWHIGTMSCHTDRLGSLSDELYTATEAEANRFAAQFLMPTDWLVGMIEGAQSVREMIERVSVAKTSIAAISIALCRVLPLGYAFAQVDDDGFVLLSSASAGTKPRPPSRGQLIEMSNYDSFARSREVFEGSGTTLYWWAFDPPKEPARFAVLVATTDPRASAEILADIMRELDLGAEGIRLQKSIAGLIGAANNPLTMTTAEELHAALLNRFSREDCCGSPIALHPDFRLFLSKKAQEIVARRR